MNAPSGCLPIGAIILAAGAGTRMGHIKQLLPYRSSTLIRHAIEQAREARFAPLIVVLGSKSAEVRENIAGLPIEITENSEWQLGMGSSIVCGMHTLQTAAPESAAVAILLADQPLVTTDHLCRMQALLSTDWPAVAAEYSGSLGVPALFQRALFPALLSLPPKAGAKQLLRELGDAVRSFPLPEAAMDIDTPEDYARLSS